MLNDVLQALRMLKRDKKPSEEVVEAIDFLDQAVQGRTRQSMLDLMAVGEVVGYEKLQEDLTALAGFIQKMKEHDGK